jgi:hypothetical protein
VPKCTPALLGLFCAVFAGAEPALAAPTETVLFSFETQAEGLAPSGSLAPDGARNFYTATDAGRSESCAGVGDTLGCSAIVKLSPPKAAGASWTETVLYRFKDGKDGGNPNQLVAYKGNLFTTTTGGDTSVGTFARLAGSGFGEK